ncbi:Fic family protein [Rhodovulum euryhalinum]|uniref:Fic family protein n=1 Tax=Rhodovulum euryhalinum TaxID=35805 RepID=UPI00104E45BD|nr:Fic family protein [Rhodovulum euryhalinum]
MILYELTGSEAHPAYQNLEIANGERHYSFLQSIVATSLEVGRPFLSQTVIKSINFHAIACLHTNAGLYRPCAVRVGEYVPPDHYRVPDLMDDFVNIVNRQWDAADPVELAAFVLWKLNHIHPFINGNGRTARASCYFVLCVKLGGWLEGDTILPELLRTNRPEYVEALKQVDASLAAGALDLSPLHRIIADHLTTQLGK